MRWADLSRGGLAESIPHYGVGFEAALSVFKQVGIQLNPAGLKQRHGQRATKSEVALLVPL